MVVQMIHILIFAFMVYAPFSSDNSLIRIHAIVVPFLFMHWEFNNDTCAITELEKYLLRTTDNSKTISGKIFSPIYKIDENFHHAKNIRLASLGLWLISIAQLQA